VLLSYKEPAHRALRYLLADFVSERFLAQSALHSIVPIATVDIFCGMLLPHRAYANRGRRRPPEG
jgi:hypothetical protein